MKSAAGFTLMEVLVALVLMTVFTVVTYRALDSVLGAQQRAKAEMERWRALATVFARMESDLSNSVAQVGARAPVTSVFKNSRNPDGSGQFELVRLLPEDQDAGLLRVGYRCAKDRLLRLVWPDVDQDLAPPLDFTLLKGLSTCEFRYLDVEGQWQPVWVAAKGQRLPRAVELKLVEAEGAELRRVWRVQ